MNLSFTLIRILALTCAALVTGAVGLNHSHAADLPVTAEGGLQLSLNTNTFQVAPDAPTGRAAKNGVRRGLVASARLANRSGKSIAFQFPDEATAAQRFVFRVLDAGGQEVWSSATASEGGDVAALLPKKSAWSRTARIPLDIEGVPLPMGRYTLEAATAGEPRIGATTLFEIVPAPVSPQTTIPKNTGIRGLVLSHPGGHMRLDGTVIAPAVMPRPVEAAIRIQEVLENSGGPQGRWPFVWQGRSDSQGRFEVKVPAGEFLVQASVLGETTTVTVQSEGTQFEPQAASEFMTIPPVPPATVSTRPVRVKVGAYSDVTLGLGGGMSYEQPRGDTGIRGSVFKPITPGQAPIPQPAAHITIEEIIPDAAVAWLRPPLRWTGFSDENGQFEVFTPPGKFRVTARWGRDHSPGSPEATVVDRQIAITQIYLQPAVLEAVRVPVHTVEQVAVSFLPTLAPPAMIQVSARGQVNTGGWTLPLLRYRGVTAEGIAEFDFVANPPSGIVTQAFAPISATTRVEQPANFKGVRVYSATNSKSAW